MAEKISLARIKKFGQTFEISIDPDLALKFKNKELTDVREVLQSEQIYSDVHKGLIISPAKLKEIFHTDDALKVAELIISEGEIQLTSEHRAKERGQKWLRLIEMIRRLSVDPRTNLPHPAERIEAALEQAKVHLDEHKPVEEQFDSIVTKLRPILPLKIEQKIMIVEIPTTFVGKSYQIVKNNSKILKEEWKSDGSWRIRMEVPAGFQQEFIDKLNAITHGECIIENE
ncbi:ribosome assembly factor SBDS [Candidatus Woesearchaeota archaeon CG_4_10_14_0_2_um_filter_33_13]|nr:MAG: ribosome assembly factor SBDS [Candidatus Woesearchaeota archaeon CG_4_10_14_0_2_um_filter_33_13]